MTVHDLHHVKLPAAGQAPLVFTSESPHQTALLGQWLGEQIRPQLKAGVFLTLDGPLGAGKTALVRSIATALGARPGAVSSPSFVLINEYQGDGVTIYHADAYRLTGPEELENLGWEEMLSESDRLILLEWPQRVSGLAGLDDPGTGHVRIEPTGEKSRRIAISR